VIKSTIFASLFLSSNIYIFKEHVCHLQFRCFLGPKVPTRVLLSMRVRARVRLRAFLFLLLLLFSFNFRDWKERVRKEDREPARLLFFLLPLYCVCYDADVLLFLSFSVYLFISNEQVEDGLQSREKDPGRVRR
jgi:hypothetical protein